LIYDHSTSHDQRIKYKKGFTGKTPCMCDNNNVLKCRLIRRFLFLLLFRQITLKIVANGRQNYRSDENIISNGYRTKKVNLYVLFSTILHWTQMIMYDMCSIKFQIVLVRFVSVTGNIKTIKAKNVRNFNEYTIKYDNE